MFVCQFILLIKNDEKYANNQVKLMINIFEVVWICTKLNSCNKFSWTHKLVPSFVKFYLYPLKTQFLFFSITEYIRKWAD